MMKYFIPLLIFLKTKLYYNIIIGYNFINDIFIVQFVINMVLFTMKIIIFFNCGLYLLFFIRPAFTVHVWQVYRYTTEQVLTFEIISIIMTLQPVITIYKLSNIDQSKIIFSYYIPMIINKSSSARNSRFCVVF